MYNNALIGLIPKIGIINPSSSPPITYTSGESVSNVVTSVINSANPVFTYYDINNNELSSPVAAKDVKMVKVHLEVNINPNRAPDNINIQSYATIRNLSEYDRAN